LLLLFFCFPKQNHPTQMNTDNTACALAYQLNVFLKMLNKIFKKLLFAFVGFAFLEYLPGMHSN
jgi:hypothetical protein